MASASFTAHFCACLCTVVCVCRRPSLLHPVVPHPEHHLSRNFLFVGTSPASCPTTLEDERLGEESCPEEGRGRERRREKRKWARNKRSDTQTLNCLQDQLIKRNSYLRSPVKPTGCSPPYIMNRPPQHTH